MEWIAFDRIDKVGYKDDSYNNERVDPSVTKGEVLPTPEQTMRFSTFGVRTGDLGLGIALEKMLARWQPLTWWELTGDDEGEVEFEVGSRVDNAEAPVSPRNSAPRLLDFRRERGIFAYVLVSKLPEFS